VKMAMGMRLGAGGVPMLPFAGDPNGVGGPAPVLGTQVYDTTNGIAYVGRYVARMEGNDVITIPTLNLSQGASLFAFYRLVQIGAGNAYNIRYRLLNDNGYGLLERLNSNRTTLLWMQGKADGSGIAFGFDLPLTPDGGQRRIASTIGQGGVAQINVNGEARSSSTTGNNIVPGTSISGGNSISQYAYIAICNIESTAQQLKDFVDFGALPCEPLMIFSPARMFPSAGTTFPNPGSAGGNFEITDGAPSTIQQIAWVPANVPI
jgi:hypothetical protein